MSPTFCFAYYFFFLCAVCVCVCKRKKTATQVKTMMRFDGWYERDKDLVVAGLYEWKKKNRGGAVFFFLSIV